MPVLESLAKRSKFTLILISLVLVLNVVVVGQANTSVSSLFASTGLSSYRESLACQTFKYLETIENDGLFKNDAHFKLGNMISQISDVSSIIDNSATFARVSVNSGRSISEFRDLLFDKTCLFRNADLCQSDRHSVSINGLDSLF
ncbi:hypothetical protein GEMRC1_001933 [Eukaryota sp. GEM-RC1]